MTREHNRGDSPRSREIPRREFLKLAAMAGLLAGCRPAQQLATTPTSPPTSVPTATPTSVPTATPPPTAPVRRPDVIRMYPQVPSKVVHTHHAGVWNDETLVPGAIRQMLDASITKLTGLNDAREAWAALFAPDERIAIKVNTIYNSLIWTHVPLVMAVAECLQEAGIPAEQIVVFDRETRELKNAGYPVNRDGPGVRYCGTDSHYSAGWTVVGSNIRLSEVMLSCDALINIPILKSHALSGTTFAMKNHFGTFDKPEYYHQGNRMMHGIAELNALPPIKDRCRLIVGDVLSASLREARSWPYWRTSQPGDAILMSFDAVAHDTVGLQIFSQMLAADEGDPAAAASRTNAWLQNGAELGLGTNVPGNIELAEVNLG